MRRSWTAGWLAIIAVAVCAVSLAGCTSVKSGIDPSGEHVFTPPPPPSPSSSANAYPSDLRYFDDPMNRLPWDDVAVLIEPRETVVPVGSEVILIAGVAGQDGYLRTNRRLEWSVAPGGVGHFVAIEKNGLCDLMLGDFNWPRIVNSTFAVGSTARDNVRLNRGTPTTEDDKLVLSGQGWITLTSPIEGTSHVTVVAPEVYGWDARTKSATVHFVDVVVQYPPPAINPANTKHTFTTTVLRYSNQSPCENWRVRYEIVGGPPAGFMPGLTASIEVPTNSAGQACAEIVQKQPASGVNKISIQVIRPPDAPGAGGQRLVVGNGTTTKTWSAADLSVCVTGPTTASVGSTVTCRIELSNPGDLVAKDVAATIDVPEGLTFVSANPTAEAAGRQLRWRFGDLGARQRRPIEVNFRAERQGSAVTCCDATAAGGLKVRDCATTTIGLTASPPAGATPPAASGAPLEVLLTPAETTATVGDKVTFNIAIANHARSDMTKLRIRVHLDPGLWHKKVDPTTNSLDLDLPSLSANEKQPFVLSVDVTKPGRWSNTITVSASNVAPVKAQAWVNAVAAAGAAPPPIAVTVTGPPKPLTVGRIAMFIIDVKNTGNAELRNLKVVDRCDATLDRTAATDGWRSDNDALVWNIDALPAGETTTLKLQCTCQAESAKAYHRVNVSLPDGSQVNGAAFVEIQKTGETSPPTNRPPAGPTPPATSPDKGLSLSAGGLSDRVQPGKQLTYEIRVANVSTATTYQQIAVKAVVPDGMTVVPLGTTSKKITKEPGGTVVEFDVARELAPRNSLTYRVRVLAKQLGDYHFHAELTASGLAKPMTFDADVTEVRD